jgi:hypothetical protein
VFKCSTDAINGAAVDNSKYTYYIDAWFFVMPGEASPSLRGVLVELTAPSPAPLGSSASDTTAPPHVTSHSTIQGTPGTLMGTPYQRTWISVPAAAFQPVFHDAQYEKPGHLLKVLASPSEEPRSSVYVADVQLPHGWDITGMESCYYLRTDLEFYPELEGNGSVGVTLLRTDAAITDGVRGSTAIAYCCPESDPVQEFLPGSYKCLASSILAPEVDNSRFTYYLECTFAAELAEDPAQLAGVIIELSKEIQ